MNIRALPALAARQHGVVTAAQLLQAGLTRPGVSYWVKTGRLHPIHRGVYAVGHARLSQHGQWMAAVLAGGLQAALSHLSAAVLWNTWRRRVTGSDVIAPRRRPQRGIRFRVRTLRARDVTVRDGIPVTTMARTLVDLAEVLTEHQLANVIHEAAFRRLFSAHATRAAMGDRRLPRLERALTAHATGSAGTKSTSEDSFLALIEAAGLPRPRVNTHVHEIEVDFHWPDRNLCVEIDGPGHARPRTRAEDEARDHALLQAGLTVLRFTGDDVDQRPAAVLAALE